MPQDVFTGAAISTRLTAFKRTLHCAEGTKNTAVAGPGSHDKAATQTFIEIQAAVLGDLLGMRVAACRTRDNGFYSSHRRSGRSFHVCSGNLLPVSRGGKSGF